jgi:hypothetical protein
MYPIPYPSVVFTFKLTIKSIKEFRGALDFASQSQTMHSTLDTKDVPSSQPKEQMPTKSWELKVGPMVIKGEMKTIQ